MQPILHHIDFAVSDFDRSRAFYIETLKPLWLLLAIEFVRDDGCRVAGFGPLPDPVFWIRSGATPGSQLHVAFLTESRARVDAFHAAALRAGGTDNGAPGLRPRYGDNWYAAYALDPDGHNIEAVCHDPA